MAERRTIQYFQWLRALGAVSIVLLHVFVTVHAAVGRESLGTVRYLVENGIAVAGARWAVPAFFMMSGALMLDPTREMGWRKTLGHVWRMGFVLLTFGYGFCLVESAVTAGSLGPAELLDALEHLVSGRSWDHMWFVYTLLAFYLVTPVLRPWVAQASREEYGRVVFVFAALSLGSRGLSALLPYSLYDGLYLPQNLVYYLLGYYAHRYLELDGRWVCAGVASLLLMLWGRCRFDLGWVSDPVRGVVLPYAVLVFLLAKRFLEVDVERFPLVAVLADYSFGIYLMHVAFQHLIVRYVDPLAFPALAYDLLVFALSLGASAASVWLLRRIPLFRDKV